MKKLFFLAALCLMGTAAQAQQNLSWDRARRWLHLTCMPTTPSLSI